MTTGIRRIKILVFAASPSTRDRLALDEEIRAIKEKIRAASHRDSIELEAELAARPDDVIQSLNEHKPHIVHFCGHGSEANEILLIGNDGEEKPVSAPALQELFSTLKDNVRLVFFNACYARVQAEAVVKVIDAAIGMNEEIGDEAAIAFAGSFYRALGFGRSVQEAFDQGKVALKMEGIGEENTPELLVRNGIDAAKVVLVQPIPESIGPSLSRQLREQIVPLLRSLPERRRPVRNALMVVMFSALVLAFICMISEIVARDGAYWSTRSSVAVVALGISAFFYKHLGQLQSCDDALVIVEIAI